MIYKYRCLAMQSRSDLILPFKCITVDVLEIKAFDIFVKKIYLLVLKFRLQYIYITYN